MVFDIKLLQLIFYTICLIIINNCSVYIDNKQYSIRDKSTVASSYNRKTVKSRKLLSNKSWCKSLGSWLIYHLLTLKNSEDWPQRWDAYALRVSFRLSQPAELDERPVPYKNLPTKYGNVWENIIFRCLSHLADQI